MTENKHLADMLEPLKVALRLEQEGKRFFADAAATVNGKAAKQTFEFLAAEEDKHIRRIEELYQALEESDGLEALDTEDSDAESRFIAFNDRMAELRNEIKPTISDIEAYKTALKFENGAEDFYAEQVAKSHNPKIKKFYTWLIHEESMHAKVLKSCLRFAEDPASWFQERGKSS
ncbi:MAG: ferritin family protein [candidate division Zixibacteria bacterium]|nr:ferritin family protein [candidate division Zixibacteria bacterium]